MRLRKTLAVIVSFAGNLIVDVSGWALHIFYRMYMHTNTQSLFFSLLAGLCWFANAFVVRQHILRRIHNDVLKAPASRLLELWLMQEHFTGIIRELEPANQYTLSFLSNMGCIYYAIWIMSIYHLKFPSFFCLILCGCIIMKAFKETYWEVFLSSVSWLEHCIKCIMLRLASDCVCEGGPGACWARPREGSTPPLSARHRRL